MNDIDSVTALALAGSRRKPMLWFVAIMGAVLLGVMIATGRDPAHDWPLHNSAGAFVAAAAILFVLVCAVWPLYRAGVCVAQGILIVNTGLGTSRMALADLRVHGLRVIDLNEHGELKPGLRLGGHQPARFCRWMVSAAQRRDRRMPAARP